MGVLVIVFVIALVIGFFINEEYGALIGAAIFVAFLIIIGIISVIVTLKDEEKELETLRANVENFKKNESQSDTILSYGDWLLMRNKQNYCNLYDCKKNCIPLGEIFDIKLVYDAGYKDTGKSDFGTAMNAAVQDTFSRMCGIINIRDASSLNKHAYIYAVGCVFHTTRGMKTVILYKVEKENYSATDKMNYENYIEGLHYKIAAAKELLGIAS